MCVAQRQSAAGGGGGGGSPKMLTRLFSSQPVEKAASTKQQFLVSVKWHFADDSSNIRIRLLHLEVSKKCHLGFSAKEKKWAQKKVE